MKKRATKIVREGTAGRGAGGNPRKKRRTSYRPTRATFYLKESTRNEKSGKKHSKKETGEKNVAGTKR